MTTAVWWVRRDLRLDDNQALGAAIERSERVVPTFVLDPRILESDWAGEKRVAFLVAGLRRLDEDLRTRGSRLIVRRGDPVDCLTQLVRETGADAIYAAEDHSPFARRRDARVAEALPLRRLEGVVTHPPGCVLKTDGDPYVVFTPFKRAWHTLPAPSRAELIPAPASIATPEGLAGEPMPQLPTLPQTVPFEPGEREALRRLDRFVGDARDGAIGRYAEDRNRMDLTGTSGLSPYLRFGMLSPRRAVVTAMEVAAGGSPEVRMGAEVFLSELVWREFYVHILHHFPHVLTQAFRAEYRSMQWHEDEGGFQAWRSGHTGYPVVDAAMRQLAATGWMHNRGRMITASFLVKDLLINWQAGERHFMRHLVDGDPAANNGGWQWSAGVGTDAAPYFRVFNPVSQGKRFDPAGAYVRQWVPELEIVPDAYIHTPWLMPDEVQREAGCIVGTDYPAPILDHAHARERALATYQSARQA